MKSIIIKYWKEFSLMILSISLIFLLLIIFRPIDTNFDLNKYKLEEIDDKINKLNQIQINLIDSLQEYQKKIKMVDDRLEKIKIQKTEVNNFYIQKNEEIKNADKKQMDSLFRLRYNF